MKISKFKLIITELFGFTAPTYYRWKKENRPIISLLKKYHSNRDLEEFLETGKIKKLERLKELEEIERKFKILQETLKAVIHD